MSSTIACPVLGQITVETCVDIQSAPNLGEGIFAQRLAETCPNCPSRAAEGGRLRVAKGDLRSQRAELRLQPQEAAHA